MTGFYVRPKDADQRRFRKQKMIYCNNRATKSALIRSGHKQHEVHSKGVEKNKEKCTQKESGGITKGAPMKWV